ncbi:MAG: ABC transporter ATP-binding protein [Spirochaetales bacterium]
MNIKAPAPAALLTVEDLTVAFGSTPVVEDLSFSVYPGRTLGVIGESGSGKSMTALSIMRLADLMGAHFTSGHIRFEGQGGSTDLLLASQKTMRGIRGKDISMIFQEPMTSLDPIFTVGDQIAEALILHKGMDMKSALAEARRLLDMVRLPDAGAMIRRFPHQLSGGMRQRVMISMALACGPKLLIADEPTTALDVTIQAQILAIMRELQRELGMAVIFITHDMGVVAEMADDVVVMRKGKKVEEGSVSDIFRKPAHPYTRTLLAAVPRLGSMAGEILPKIFPIPMLEGDDPLTSTASAFDQPDAEPHDTARFDQPPLLSIQDLVVRFDVKKDILGRATHRVHAAEKVSFSIFPGETLALVGESGSGKSTIGRAIQQLQAINSGEIQFNGRSLASMGVEGRRKLQQEVQYIFQDPFASLDPRQTVGFSVSEPLRVHHLLKDEKKIQERVVELLEDVGLRADYATRYPHEFSGGQRQRVCIARALASGPKLIIADEALSSMDVSIQAQIINLFMKLQKRHGLAYLFISHDMAVVERMSHRVAVLYLGQIVEIGSRAQVFGNPQHPYTRKLMEAVPVTDPSQRRHRPVSNEEIPSPIRRSDDSPAIVRLREVNAGHFVAEA